MNAIESAISSARQLRHAGQAREAFEALRPWLHSANAAVLEEAALVADALQAHEDAIRYLQSAVQVDPGRVSAWINLAVFQAEAGDHSASAASSRRACSLSPQFVPAWVNLGSSLAHSGDYPGAIQAYTKALALAPGNPDLMVDLASAQFVCGELAPAIQLLSNVLRANPKDIRARSLFLLGLHHATNNATGLAREHHAFAVSLSATRINPRPSGVRADRPIRLGLVSGDFRRHSVWYFLQALLKNLPALGFELHCFHTDILMDAVTEVWRRGSTRFVEAAGTSDDDMEALIRQSDVDVLINLGGHTVGGRPTLFLRRVAPLQVSFLGYPGPIGSPNIDYWLADPIVAPDGELPPESFGGIARLPGSYFCFSADAEIAAKSALSNEPIMFGSFNVLTKISATTVRLWARVLKAVPGSSLTIKNEAVNGPAAARLLREFADCGIAAERIRWLSWTAGRDDHLRRYQQIDLALDTFPFNGATTTCEALWMGVPVVTMKGATPASRMAASILTAAGYPQWIAESEDAFVAIAVSLAMDVERLRASRAELRRSVEESALCDERAFGADFAALVRNLLGHHDEDLGRDGNHQSPRGAEFR